jgi:hypothetical protein
MRWRRCQALPPRDCERWSRHQAARASPRRATVAVIAFQTRCGSALSRHEQHRPRGSPTYRCRQRPRRAGQTDRAPAGTSGVSSVQSCAPRHAPADRTARAPPAAVRQWGLTIYWCPNMSDVQTSCHPEARRISALSSIRSRPARFFACGLRMTPRSRDTLTNGRCGRSHNRIDTKEVAKRLAGLRKRRRRAPISLSVEGYHGRLSYGPGWR